MTLDARKLLIYVLVLGALAGTVWFFLFQSDADEPPLVETPGPVVLPPVATAPVLSPPCKCEEPPPPVVVVVPDRGVAVHERQPAPAAGKRTPRPDTKAPAVKQPKAVVVKPGCGQVPVEAYQYPKDVVLEAAARRGVGVKDMATLRRCIGA